jgi:hypothetical protein
VAKSSAIRVRVEGSRQARDSLRRAGAQLDDLKEAHTEIANIIQPVAAGAAPRRTGRLAGSGRASGSKREATVSFGNRLRYARPIHWGWPARNISPHRFLWDAQQSTEPRWTQVYHQAIQRILDRIKGA